MIKTEIQIQNAPKVPMYPASCSSMFCGKCVGYGCDSSCRYFEKLQEYLRAKMENANYWKSVNQNQE